MAEVDLAYMAGLFDGEGCISISRGAKSWNLSCYIITAGEYLPRLFQFSFGGSIQRRKQNPAHPNWHDYYKWHISAKKALAFLETLYPYLRLKKPQAELAIQFQERLSNNPNHRIKLTDNELALRRAYIIQMKKLKVDSYEN